MERSSIPWRKLKSWWSGGEFIQYEKVAYQLGLSASSTGGNPVSQNCDDLKKLNSKNGLNIGVWSVVVRGGAKGAALGALGGAIAGNAGKGAKIDARILEG